MASDDRRGFLRGLAMLPLIGGSVALIGSPVRAAVPATRDMLAAYDQWLFYERRFLLHESYGHRGSDMVRAMEKSPPIGTLADAFHFPPQGSCWVVPAPSTRAAIILSAAGVPIG